MCSPARREEMDWGFLAIPAPSPKLHNKENVTPSGTLGGGGIELLIADGEIKCKSIFRIQSIWEVSMRRNLISEWKGHLKISRRRKLPVLMENKRPLIPVYSKRIKRIPENNALKVEL